MATQSINNVSLSIKAKEARKSTAENAKKLLLYKNYRLGNNWCEKEQFDSDLILEIDALNNSELNCYINRIISQGPEEYLPCLPKRPQDELQRNE